MRPAPDDAIVIGGGIAGVSGACELARDGRVELSDLADTINRMLDRVSDGVATERRFVADAAHELRSPIAASTALLEVALGVTQVAQESDSQS
jgi:signal transduction histidine kinase